VQAYCINREQFDFILDVTKFKSKAEWAEDPMKDIDTKTKSAFTRTFNKQVSLLGAAHASVVSLPLPLPKLLTIFF
jgi:hypothetical protein